MLKEALQRRVAGGAAGTSVPLGAPVRAPVRALLRFGHVHAARGRARIA
jgi:hypothetical protein